MIQVCRYLDGRDIQETVPHLSVSLSEALETGSVRDVGVASEPNGLDEVERVGSIVSDAFEAYDAMHGVSNDSTGLFVNTPNVQGSSPDKE